VAVISVAGSTVALLIAGAAIIAYEWMDTRDRVTEEVRMLADLLGTTNTETLAHGDATAAQQSLESLANVQQIISACVYTADNEVFCDYEAEGSAHAMPPPSEEAQGVEIKGERLTLHRPIFLDGERLGTIYLVADMREFNAAIVRLLVLLVIITLVAAGISLSLTNRLQRFITRPILHLVETASRIRERQDYDVRAVRQSDDELGTLVDGFNAMLSQIQQRDLALREARVGLEQRVDLRTRELREEIEERERIELQLREARDTAETASRAKSDFLANMSHEIRTPMNGIIGMTRIALETDLTTEQHHYLHTVASSADALLSIINDILDFSKIEAGRLELERTDFDVRQCIGDALSVVAVRAHEKTVELAQRVRPDVPEFVVGDPLRLRQILLNLIGNAIKFTSEGEVVVEARCHTARVSDPDSVWLQLSVRDTGVGIPPDKQAMIFDEFSQADTSTTRRHGGTGLGLSISKKLVEMMGGRMWVRSEPGRGSTFYFTVRVGVSTQRGAERRDDDMTLLAGVPVLVVDNNQTNLEILVEMMRQWGIEPHAHTSGENAVKDFESSVSGGTPYPVVLLDCLMPKMDGFEVARRIRRLSGPERTRVILLSSAIDRGTRSRLSRLGIDASLAKPVQQSDLLNEIMPVCGHRSRKVRGRTSGRAGVPELPSLKVLLAEDNRVNQELAVILLEKSGHRVTVVDDGKKAVDAVRDVDEPFDVVLMDVQMPVMGGYESTRTIRKIADATRRHVPIIGLTAHAMAGDRERCLRSGMDDYVSKPINPDRLFDAISDAVSAARKSLDRLSDAPGSETGDAPREDVGDAPRENVGDAPREDVGDAPRENVGDAPRENVGDAPVDSAFHLDVVLANLGGDMEIFRQVAAVYIDSAPEMMAAVEAAVEAHDHDALRRAGHAFKGAISNFQITRATEAARTVEFMGRDKADWSAIRTAVGRLREETTAVLAHLRRVESGQMSPS